MATLSTSKLTSAQLTSGSGWDTFADGHGVPAAGEPRYYAVCSSTQGGTSVGWADTGIRVTISEIFDVQMSSGYGHNRLHKQGLPNSGSATADGTLWRDMTSEVLATNVLPKAAGVVLQYVFSPYSSGCYDSSGAAQATCASGNGKYISLVDASLNSGDPCVLQANTNPASGTSALTDVMTAATGTKQITVDASTLDETKTFAVCYSKGEKLWSSSFSDWATTDATTDAAKDGAGAITFWQDSYVRLKVSLVESITTIGVTHRTYGQVPNTIANDNLDFVLHMGSTLGQSMRVSLVDASLNSEDPCSSSTHAEGAADTTHSGVATASTVHKCVLFDTTNAGSNCGTGGTDACSLNTQCNPANANSGGCGDTGQCRRVFNLQTHTLTTSPTASRQYYGAPVDNILTGSQSNRNSGTTTITGLWFALCYEYNNAASFTDSGIRVSVSKISSVRLSSGIAGVPSRDHTSLQLATNRIPRQGSTGTYSRAAKDQELEYKGTLAAGKYVSLVRVGINRCRNLDASGTTASRLKCDISLDGTSNEECVEGARCDPTDSGCGPTGSCVPDNNPCVNGVEAGRALSAPSPAIAQTNSGPSHDSNSDSKVTFDLNGLDVGTIQDGSHDYAVCYDADGNGASTSVTWMDSYIRFKTTEVGEFGTLNQMIKTYGQLPKTGAGLVYNYIGRLQASRFVALVDPALNTGGKQGFSGTFAMPCAAAVAGATADTSRTGKLGTAQVSSWFEVKTVSTTSLLRSHTKEYALCFSTGDGSTSTTSGGWEDSGIRFSISEIDSLSYSGYSATEAAARSKKDRKISATPLSLQTSQFAASVLPKAILDLRYIGDLAHSSYLSFVETSQNGGHPCANPAVAGAAASTTASGPMYACTSAAERSAHTCTKIGANPHPTACDNNNDDVYDEACALNSRCLVDQVAVNNGGCGTGGVCSGGYTSPGACAFVTSLSDGSDGTKNKEVQFPAVSIQGLTTHDGGSNANTFAVCYMSSEGTLGPTASNNNDNGRTNDYTPTWKDSYIRVTFSDITSIIADGVTHTDHGQIGNYEAAVPLKLSYTSALTTNLRFSLVDETLGNGQIAARAPVTAATAYTNTPTPAPAPSVATEVDYLSGVSSANEPCIWSNQAAMGADATNHKEQDDDHTDVNTATGAQKEVSFVTSGLDTTKQYALCYAPAGSGTIWYDSGIRLTITELNTLRDNMAQLPLLRLSVAGPSGHTDTSKFKRDLTSSRAKIGRHFCTTVGTTPDTNCDNNEDGKYAEACGYGTLCDPSNANNGGCGSGKGVCTSALGYRASGTNTWSSTLYSKDTTTRFHVLRQTGSGGLNLEYLGPLTHTSKVSLVDTRLNSNDPCVSTHVASTATYHCSAVDLDNSPTCDVNNDGVFDEMCTQGAYCRTDSTGANAGCGTNGACTAKTDYGLRQTGEITATTSAKTFAVPSATLINLDATKTYTVCYYTGSEWRDSYIRMGISKVSDITAHSITHRTQGHLARANPLAVVYGGTLAPNKWLNLVDDTVACSGCSTPASCSGPAQAPTSSNTVNLDTAALLSSKNYAVCYSEDGTTWSDSSIRVTISMVTSIQYNKQSLSSNQQGTFDYVRDMAASNVAPATDTVPVATNVIPQKSNIDMHSVDDQTVELNFAIVAVDANTDSNPCASHCDGSGYCNWDQFAGAMGAESTIRSGVAIGGANGAVSTANAFRITQASNYLDATKTFAVCYSQTWLDTVDPSGSGTTWVNKEDKWTFRDSGVRLKVSKIYALSSYGIDHFTTGDIAAKAKLYVTPKGQLSSSSSSRIRLVDESVNGNQACSQTESALTAASTAQTGAMGSSQQRCDSIGTSPGTTCDVNRDGTFGETCVANALTTSTSGCGIGATVTYPGYYEVATQTLSTDITFALCYLESGSTYTDTGIRLQLPKVQAVTYGAPARVIRADSCFSGSLEDKSSGIADCHVFSSTADQNLDQAHVQIGSIIPRARDVKLTYGGGSYGSSMAAGKWISLVEHQKANFDTPETPNGQTSGYQANNPCRNAMQAANTPADAASPGSAPTPVGVLNTVTEGGMRLQSGAQQAATDSYTVTIPQAYDAGAAYTSATRNYLDYTKTYAVCYSDGDGSNSDAQWRDSYVRVTLNLIEELSMVHTGYPFTLLNLTTTGTFSNVPSLGVQFSGSLPYNSWLRIVNAGENNNAPCAMAFAGAAGAADNVKTSKIQSLGGSKRVTFDSSPLAQTNAASDNYAVCYATSTGATNDNTWYDSGLRVRLIRWVNSEKWRVVSGAPVRLSFALSSSVFDTDMDKVAFLKDQTSCGQAPAAPVVSDGSSVKRTLDYVCEAVHTDAANICDTHMDGTFNDKCMVGSLCNPSNANNGGCGSAGSAKCVAAVQLPTGEAYDEVQDATPHQEVALGEGNYAVCLCLGGTSSTYGPPNGNGGCDDANEWTLVFANNNALGLKIIAKPLLGRYQDTGGQGLVRLVAGKSQQYNIKAATSTPGMQVENNDRIYFMPSSVGCGQHTKFSGPGVHTYVHETNSYASSADTDRRWRAQNLYICTSVGGTNVASVCDTNTADGLTYQELCVRNAFCDPTNTNNGGCGSTGACASPIPSTDMADGTTQLVVSGYSTSTTAALVTTPSGTPLSTVGSYTACFTTNQAVAGTPTDSTDFVALADGLEVIASPRVGVLSSPGNVRALEGSSPTFTVSPMAAQDRIYFVPQTQNSVLPVANDCIPYVCTSVGGSSIGANCDLNHDGTFGETCAVRARCDHTNNFNGGCGTSGTCQQQIPTAGTTTESALIAGTAHSTSSTAMNVQLPTSPTFQVPFWQNIDGRYPTAYYFVMCFIPAGAKSDEVTNVAQLADRLTLIKDPTDVLITTWYQFQVQELRFTQPQQGHWTADNSQNFAGGESGDIIVLKKATTPETTTTNHCADVETITAASYTIYQDPPYNLIRQTHSSPFTLTEAGNVVTGDEKGGVAAISALAQGKVNELATGTYKVCYATGSSGGDANSDFKTLTKEIEILPAPAGKPAITTPRSVILGQDIIVHWASNNNLETYTSTDNSWLGLYEVGACSTEEMHARHQCYKAAQFIKVHQSTGTVIFSQSDYKISGEYEIRYFRGDSRNGQGEKCDGLTDVPTETYLTCQLVAAATSETVRVLGADVEETEDLGAAKMEAVFAAGDKRFHRTTNT
jgi:hypothetical protein